MASHIKCFECGVFNTDREYCKNCGALLSYKKRREIAYKKANLQQKEKERLEKKSNPSFFEKYENHNNFIVRATIKVLKSIGLVFIAIGTFIAWLFTAIAA
ncbi:hypothetical protein ACFQ1Q_04205 [Winogradskyella litorisediminis]|uniref:Zinc ribbon protein n=1 Tax=Winogradskyella litorisediminis TaxID=1156618 RepID=A0ABW3N6A9_9FLAO